jgi:hypothetical protein
MQLGSGQ